MPIDNWDESLLNDPHFTYRIQREAWRDKSRALVMVADSPAEEITAFVEDMLAGIGLGLSGVSWRHVPEGKYVSDLVVSFIRTHFIVFDLLIASELIESTTLLRKQLELVSRLNELTDGEVPSSRLVGRVPNVRNVRSNAGGLYGTFSGVAHSSDPKHLELLGSSEALATGWTSLYPKYGSNTLVAVHNYAHVALEFVYWAIEFFPRHDLPLRDPKLGGMAARVVERMNELAEQLS